MREIYQQGDCLIRKLSALPVGSKIIAPRNGRYVLVEGEFTEHSHAIYGVEWGKVYEAEKVLYLDVQYPVEVRHEEHRPQVILPGIYEISRTREIDPFTQEIRSVKD